MGESIGVITFFDAALALAPVLLGPAADGGSVALVGLASGGHILGQSLDILLLEIRKISL